jgi:collagenase-like PrtC family protease
MKIAAQADDLKLLEEASRSECEIIRFGPEFCEYNLPSREILREAYSIVGAQKKEFMFVTPRLSNGGIENVRKLFAFLDEKGSTSIVVNDLGTLNILPHFRNLKPRLGRLMLRVPARSPWADKIAQEGLIAVRRYPRVDQLVPGGFFVKRWYEKLFSYTSLDYVPTIEFYRSRGVRTVELDWIPRLRARHASLMRQGLKLSVHLGQFPVTMTRKCHTARFLGEESPETCSKPCLKEAFVLKSRILDVELLLLGNAVFSPGLASPEDVGKMKKANISELIVNMNPITDIDSVEKMDELISCLKIHDR